MLRKRGISHENQNERKVRNTRAKFEVKLGKKVDFYEHWKNKSTELSKAESVMGAVCKTLSSFLVDRENAFRLHPSLPKHGGKILILLKNFFLVTCTYNNLRSFRPVICRVVIVCNLLDILVILQHILMT